MLHMTFGTDTVVAEGRNVSVNGAALPEGRPYLHKGEVPKGTGPGRVRMSPQNRQETAGRGEQPAATRSLSPSPRAGLGVTWPGDWVAVASGLGVRVAWDAELAVTVTAEPELRGGTWGLCGTYTDDPAGEFHAGSAAPTPLGGPGDAPRAPRAPPSLSPQTTSCSPTGTSLPSPPPSATPGRCRRLARRYLRGRAGTSCPSGGPRGSPPR